MTAKAEGCVSWATACGQSTDPTVCDMSCSVFLWPLSYDIIFYYCVTIIIYCSIIVNGWPPMNGSKLANLRTSPTLDVLLLLYRYLRGWYLRNTKITFHDHFNDNNYGCVHTPTAAASRRRSRGARIPTSPPV